MAQDEAGRIEYGTEEGQFTMDKCPEYTLPGTYRTYFRVVKPNYVTFTGSADVTIEKNTLQVQSEGYSGDFDGNPHSISIQADKDAVVRYGTKKGEYTTTLCPSYVNVGRYNVYFEVSRTGYETFYGMRMVIIKRKQIHELIFPTATAIFSGDRLGSSMLSENYNTYGIFSWKTPNVVPEAGSGFYPVVFEPKDLVNYDFSAVEGYDEEEKKITRQVAVHVMVPTPKPTSTPDITPDTIPGTTPMEVVSPDELQEGQGISQWIQLFDNWQERKSVRDGSSVRRPGRVKIKEAKRKKKKIYIRWKKTGGAVGYQVLCSPKRSMKTAVKRKNVRKMRTSFKWRYSPKCYVKIRAYSTSGKKKLYGKWSQIRRVKG